MLRCLTKIHTELERPQSRPHWLLLIYSFQFRSAFLASDSRRLRLGEEKKEKRRRINHRAKNIMVCPIP